MLRCNSALGQPWTRQGKGKVTRRSRTPQASSHLKWHLKAQLAECPLRCPSRDRAGREMPLGCSQASLLRAAISMPPEEAPPGGEAGAPQINVTLREAAGKVKLRQRTPHPVSAALPLQSDCPGLLPVPAEPSSDDGKPLTIKSGITRCRSRGTKGILPGNQTRVMCQGLSKTKMLLG